jgi:hypothetical protein
MEISTPPPSLQRSKGRPVGVATSTKPTRQNAPQAASDKMGDRERGLNGIFQLGSFGLMMAGQAADAAAVAKHGGPIAHEAAALAESDAGVAKILDYLTTAGPYAGLITACMPLAMQVMVNHKMVRAEVGRQLGIDIVAPEALEAQAKTVQAKMAVAALHAQREAESELANAQREFQDDAAQQAANTPQPDFTQNGRGPDGPEAPAS